MQACVTLKGPLDWEPGHQYVIGVDLSIVKDRTAVAVMHSEREPDEDGRNVVERLVLDRLEVWQPTRKNPIDFAEVEAWIVHAAQQYRAHVHADPFQAAAMVQRIANRGVSIETTNFTPQSNDRMAVALHTTIRSHRLAIPPDQELIDELVNMRLVEKSPNQFKLDHDPDKHNDRGTAIALCVLALTQTSPGMRPVFWDDDDHGADLLGRPFAPLIGGRGIVGNTAMPASVTRDFDDDDGDGPAPGATAASPFT